MLKEYLTFNTKKILVMPSAIRVPRNREINQSKKKLKMVAGSKENGESISDSMILPH